MHAGTRSTGDPRGRRDDDPDGIRRPPSPGPCLTRDRAERAESIERSTRRRSTARRPTGSTPPRTHAGLPAPKTLARLSRRPGSATTSRQPAEADFLLHRAFACLDPSNKHHAAQALRVDAVATTTTDRRARRPEVPPHGESLRARSREGRSLQAAGWRWSHSPGASSTRAAGRARLGLWRRRGRID